MIRVLEEPLLRTLEPVRDAEGDPEVGHEGGGEAGGGEVPERDSEGRLRPTSSDAEAR